MSLTEKERLNVWRNRINWARKKREDYLKNYDLFKSYFIGDQVSLNQTSIEIIVINLIYSHIKATLPLLYFQNPHFYLSPTRDEFENSALIAESVINYLAKKQKLKREIRLSTLDALFLIGICKTGYDPIFAVNPNKGKPVLAGVAEDGSNVHVIDPDSGQPLFEPDELLIKEDFFSKRISPKNMLFDPEYKNFLEDHNWIAEEVIERLDDVKDNEYFKKSIRDDLKESHNAENEVFYTSGNTKLTEVQDDLKRIKLIHIYDFRDEKFRIFAEGQNNEDLGFLYEDDVPDGMDLHPYSILKFTEIPDEWYPLPEMKILRPIQDEINKATGIIVGHAKKFLRKYGYETGAFASEQEKEKFKEPEDGMMVEFNVNKIDKLVALPDATLDPASLEFLNRFHLYFWQTAGRTEQERGQVERRKTMFESSQIEKYGQLRNQDNMSLIEDFAVDICKKKLDQLQANMRVPLATQISGPIGKFWQEGITKEQIIGDMDINIDIGSTSPKIPEFEKKQLVDFMDMLSDIPGIENIMTMPMDEEINIGEFIKQLAKKYDVDEYNIMRKRSGKSVPLIQQSMQNQNVTPIRGKTGGAKRGKINASI